MRPLAKAISWALLLVSTVSVSTAQADIRIGIAAEPYPPFASKNTEGKWVGWEMDVIAALCLELKEKCEITETAWDGIIPALTSKKIDVIMASMAITAERKKTISFSTAYYNAAVAVIGSKDAALKPDQKALAGKTIGTQAASIHARYVEKHFTESTLKTYATLDEATSDLAAGRIDAVEAEFNALEAFLATETGKACCILAGTVPPDPEVLGEGVGAGLRTEDMALMQRINTALSQMGQNGIFKKITGDYPELANKIQVP